jgi:insecticidal toxin complex protein TccC
MSLAKHAPAPFRFRQHTGTPTLSVCDNRGLEVRQVRYHRHPDQPNEPQTRVTRHTYDARLQLTHSIDPRLGALAEQDDQVMPNLRYRRSLSGAVLLTESVDAGKQIHLPDASARPALSVSATGLLRTWHYLANQPAQCVGSISECAPRGEPQVVERFVWGDCSTATRAHNLAGQCRQHYHTAGMTDLQSLGLLGTPLHQALQLLATGGEADWQGDTATAWQALLEPQRLDQQCRVDAVAGVLEQLDAKGHRRRYAYDCTGRVRSTWMTLAGHTEQPVAVDNRYGHGGQLVGETHGNGVVSTYLFDHHHLRPAALRIERPAGHPLGAAVLQHLTYDYDPAGNIIEIADLAQPPRYWRNQRVEARSEFRYDSLYQLVHATGRERAASEQRFLASPDALTVYTRTYRYDGAGNLLHMRHSAPASGNSYSRVMTTADRNNRAVSDRLANDPVQVDSLFDAGGHQLQLSPGQYLHWNARGELDHVSPITRDGATSDTERYRYDAQSVRRIKSSLCHTGTLAHTRHTVYLDKLQLHARATGGTPREAWHVVSMGQAEHCQVQALFWEAGKPADIDNGALRYNHVNRIGSGGLELDASGALISLEEYYPFGGTSFWTTRSQSEADYKTARYSGKERDASGLYYFGFRYYQACVGRWLSADPAGAIDGLNLFAMVRNNPVTLWDEDGLAPVGDTQPNGLYQPRLRTGKDRDRLGATLAATPVDAQATSRIKAQPIPLRQALENVHLNQEALITDLFNPAKGQVSAATQASMNNVQGGGQLLFGALQMSSQGRSFNALTTLDVATKMPQAGGEYAYWAPQGGYVDIPVHPANGQPHLLFTPGFSGCTLAVDQLSSDTLRVRHVEGGKEDAQYNAASIDHGLGLVNAMEYRDYGYQQQAGTLLESVVATAFMQYDPAGQQWAIHHQSLLNTPRISSLQTQVSGIFSKTTSLQASVMHPQSSRALRNPSIGLRAA